MEQNNPATKKENRSFETGVFLHNLFIALKKAFWLPLLLAVIAGAVEFFLLMHNYTAYYTAKANFAVSANYIGSSDISSVSYYYDTNAASMLATTFNYVLQTDATKQLLVEKTGKPYLPASLRATNVAESNWLEISATATSPALAYEAIQIMVEIYPQAAANVLGAATLQQLGEPVIPDEPIRPFRPAASVTKAALIGLAVGLAIIALMADIRRTVHSAEDLNALINMPCLGYLPNVRLKKRSSKVDQAVLITNKKLPSQYAEAIRTIRYRFLKELEQTPAKVILVTSTLPDEGKSSVSSNLALSLAEQKKQVILIDGDLRKPALKKRFCITEPSVGLEGVLHGSAGKVQPITVPNSSLLIIAGDKPTSDPQKVLASANMKKLLATLREKVDYVIIDTPPTAFLSDAAALTEMVDGVVYVIRQDYANQTAILNSVQSLVGMDARYIGCVLNNTSAASTRYGYGYGRYASKYGYGYGTGGYSKDYSYGKYYYGEYGKAHGKHSRDAEPIDFGGGEEE